MTDPVDRTSDMDLLSGLASGKITSQDLVAQLKARGIDSMEAVVDFLKPAMAGRGPAAAASSTPFDPRSSPAPADPDSAARIVQRVPAVPVLIDGTLYDPKDLVRFNGRELHFVPAPGGHYMFATEDRDLIGNWRQFSVMAALDGTARTAPPLAALPAASVPIAAALYAPPHSTAWGPGTDNGTYSTFFEDINLSGDGLWCNKDRGYTDLTHHHTGVFGLGSNWNDRISSVFMHLVSVAVLYEHIQYAGQTLTLRGTENNLVPYGWNDRASSVGTW